MEHTTLTDLVSDIQNMCMNGASQSDIISLLEHKGNEDVLMDIIIKKAQQSLEPIEYEKLVSAFTQLAKNRNNLWRLE